MLRRLQANQPTFEPISFRQGLNVIVAEQAPNAGSTHTRNAKGKTTLLHVIKFMLGGSLPKQLKPLQTSGWEFSLTLDLFGEEVTVTRNLASPSRLGIEFSPEIKTTLELYVEQGTIHVDSWKELLGLAFFSLDEDKSSGPFPLSTGVLLAYAIRIEPGADPLKAFPLQPAWSARQHLAFMFGLDWRLIQKMQDISKNAETLTAVSAAVEQGLLPSLAAESDLLIERSNIQRQLSEHQNRVEGFQVLDDPNGVIAQADALTETLSQLRDQALEDARMRTLYVDALREASSEAIDPLHEDVAFLYSQAGTLLGDAISRRLDEVKAFHVRLSENRQAFIEQALDEIDHRQELRSRELGLLSSQRDNLMRALNAGGAIDELLALRDEASQLQQSLAGIELRLNQVREVTESQERLRAQRAELRREAQNQLNLSRAKLDRIAERFDSRMRRLYDVGGVLTASVDNDGYKFAINVAGQNSTGVNKMKLFCLDLALLEEGVNSSHHPDFLLHDSSVFDGVDPRQTASALSLAAEAVTQLGGQYICTLNSNDIHPEIRDTAWFEAGIIRTVLDTDPGGILGVKF
ncbi:DUF2326 domain-containing protein [Pseudarthrobacter siccitolerans]